MCHCNLLSHFHHIVADAFGTLSCNVMPTENISKIAFHYDTYTGGGSLYAEAPCGQTDRTENITQTSMHTSRMRTDRCSGHH